MTPVSLDAVLKNKELRVARQQEWLVRYQFPLVSISVNMPGAYKDTPSSQVIFDTLLHALQQALHVKGWDIQERFTCKAITGPEGLLAVNAEALAIKKLTCKVECEHPLGRFIDMDVIGTDGAILSRALLGKARRTCYLCEDEAVLCGRSRKHDIHELIDFIDQRVAEYIRE